jgi:hypothetical protein
MTDNNSLNERFLPLVEMTDNKSDKTPPPIKDWLDLTVIIVYNNKINTNTLCGQFNLRGILYTYLV